MLSVQLQLDRGAFKLDARFEAPTPGVIALFGRSGCGKTTVVDLLAGLNQEGTGSIILNDRYWLDTQRDIKVAAEKRRVGYVFQDARLFPHYSVRGNLNYGARRAPQAPSAQAFDDVVQLLGLITLLDRRPGKLSGGEKQRVALGRALLSQPDLLLLDEPLAALDAARREEVLPYLERLRDHFSIPMIFVSHSYEEVLRLATHMVVMDAGRVTASGDVGTVSMMPALQAIVGREAMGAVVEGSIVNIDVATQLADMRIGSGMLRIPAQSLRIGQHTRVHLLARDIILAVTEPKGLSVRNQLRGTVVRITAQGGADLIEVDVGGTTILSRITSAATAELALRAGSPVWVLVKAVSVSAL
jgi:molybdate transport system ATP-binding protein